MNAAWNAAASAVTRTFVWLLESTCRHDWRYEDYDRYRMCPSCGRIERCGLRPGRLNNQYWRI